VTVRKIHAIAVAAVVGIFGAACDRGTSTPIFPLIGEKREVMGPIVPSTMVPSPDPNAVTIYCASIDGLIEVSGTDIDVKKVPIAGVEIRTRVDELAHRNQLGQNARMIVSAEDVGVILASHNPSHFRTVDAFGISITNFQSPNTPQPDEKTSFKFTIVPLLSWARVSEFVRDRASRDTSTWDEDMKHSVVATRTADGSLHVNGVGGEALLGPHISTNRAFDVDGRSISCSLS
jgi:hypothetical protein